MLEAMLLVIVILLLLVIGAQSYFLYRMAQTVTVLNASPDTDSARSLLKAVGAKRAKELPKKKPSELESSPGELGPLAIANLRKLQDAK